MPVIDLDSHTPTGASPGPRARRRPRLLVMAAAGLLLLGLPGEGGHLPGILDNPCDYLAATGRASASVVLMDARSGQVTQTTTIEATCPA